ncbi:hypothetical protein ACIRU8_10360 [Streptomyces sp. NPDC101175]|uniref:hypothetical protein n=1 Tax=Streptomyces sp. NPDC101175 TaxID=3366123 RepID=UPI00383560EF
MSKDGSSLRTVQLGSDGVHHSLIVDGIDLSRGMRSAQLKLAAGELPTLTLDPIIFNLDGADLGSVRVIVTDQAAKALVALGWTPPEEAQ